MIRYTLSCEAGHSFEGWFADSRAFDAQKMDGSLSCPSCGSTMVDKALMAPAVATSRQKETMRLAANVPEHQEAIAALRKIRKHLTENADYVGPKFAEEARRIHYNETDKRGIYGEASPDEAKALTEEGIEFHPLPVLPEDHN
jgi:hypothetical protein